MLLRLFALHAVRVLLQIIVERALSPLIPFASQDKVTNLSVKLPTYEPTS